MSTIKATNLQHGSAASPNLVLDSSGNVTGAGTLAMASSFLRNRILNGDMRIDQRNAGAAQNNLAAGWVYTVDRWRVYSNNASRFSSQQNRGSVTPPTGFTNYLGLVVNTGYTPGASDYNLLTQPIEGVNVSDLAWGTANARSVTLSFWAYSSVTGTHSGFLSNSGFTTSYPFTFSLPSANTWTFVTVTATGPTTGTWATGTTAEAGMNIGFNLGNGSNFQTGSPNAWGTTGIQASGAVSLVGTTGATFYLTGVQLEVGSVATPFERRQYGQELALCQRYFETNYPAGVALGTAQGAVDGWNFFNGSASYGEANTYPFKVKKRAAPSVTSYHPSTGVAGQAYRFGTAGSISVSFPKITQDAFSGIGAQPVDAYSLFYAASAEL